ncbi:hypothetical protein LZ554_004607 [Drepanopeziza brunnea f. sp. 'monogermtubi']|nr:hypothetical protein LZ554_004607 [Drepanopeziza brunnea f. sp. 'monogermtubi']
MAPNTATEEYQHAPGFSFLPDRAYRDLTAGVRTVMEIGHEEDVEKAEKAKAMEKLTIDKEAEVTGDTYEVRKENIDEEHEVVMADAKQHEVTVIDDDSEDEGSDHEGEDYESSGDDTVEEEQQEYEMVIDTFEDDEDAAAAVKVLDPSVSAFASALSRMVNSQMETLRCSLENLLRISQDENMTHFKEDIRANTFKERITRVNDAVREQMEVDFRNTAKRIKMAILKKAMEELDRA